MSCFQKLAALIVAGVFLTPVYADTAPRWNILFVFADDWGRYASCYKGLDGRPTINDVIHTPAVDRVAREGIVFKNAFVNAPSCTPCRSSLLSGRHFFNTGRGAILQGAIWDASIPTFPLLLKDLGYQIGKSYKVWSPGSPADAPFGGQQFAHEKAGRAPNNFSEEMATRMDKGMSLEKAKEEILAQVAGNFSDFKAASKTGQPWHYFLGITTTHRTWIKGSGKKLWNINPDDLKGKLPKFLPDVEEVRQDVADYLGECQAVDAYVAVLLKKLEESGELTNTLIVLSGDHGMPGVPHGKCNLYSHGVAVPLVVRVPGGKGSRVLNDFVFLPDLAPTFVEVAGGKFPGKIDGNSIFPLLQSGKSGQIDPSRTWVISGRERHVGFARDNNLPYPVRSIRNRDFVYIRNFEPDRWPMGNPEGADKNSKQDFASLQNVTYTAFADMDASPTKAWLVTHANDPKWKWHYELAFAKRPAEELFDLSNDPDQVNNVAKESKYTQVKQELSQQLLAKLKEAGDPRLVKTPVPFEKPPFTDIDPFRLNKGKAGKKKAGE
ncbi:MAG: sulfatase [Gemmataceae bacterium]|nr:sulfatase [Gemmataceae bacterium]